MWEDKKEVQGVVGLAGLREGKCIMAERGCRCGWKGASLSKLQGKQARADGRETPGLA